MLRVGSRAVGSRELENWAELRAVRASGGLNGG